jgi:hypothetical protein
MYVFIQLFISSSSRCYMSCTHLPTGVVYEHDIALRHKSYLKVTLNWFRFP